MSSYRRLWWVVVLTIGLPSASLGAAMSPISAVVVTATGAGLALGAGIVFRSDSERCWRELACAGTLVVAAGPALDGATLPLLVLAAVSSPCVAERALLRPSASHHRQRLATEVTTDTWCDAEVFLSVLDGRELCELWGSSFVWLKSASTANERAAAATLRASLLDEMERRNSGGFAAWLARSPSPVSGPGWRIASTRDESVPDG